MFRVLLSTAVCLMLCVCSSSCVSSRKPFPHKTPNDIKLEQEYRDGNITWSEYQSKLNHESTAADGP